MSIGKRRPGNILRGLLIAAILALASATASAGTWTQLPGCAWSLAGNYVIGCGGNFPGGAGVYALINGDWVQQGFTGVSAVGGPSGVVSLTYLWQGGVNITTDPSGKPWIVTNTGVVQKFRGPDFATFGTRNCENPVPACTRHDRTGISTLAVGANDDAWMVDCQKYSGTNDYLIRHWNGSCWDPTPGAALQVAVDADGRATVINSVNDVYAYVGATYVKVSSAAKSITRGALLPQDGKRIAPWLAYGELIMNTLPTASLMQIYGTPGGTPDSPATGVLYALDVGGGIYRYDGPRGQGFQNMTEAGDPSWAADWDVCRGKATCPNGSGMMGLSVATLTTPAIGHEAMCLPHPVFSGNITGTLTVDNGNAQHFLHAGDWAPGYWKLECGQGEYVSGVSEDSNGCPPSVAGNGFHAIQCTASAQPWHFTKSSCTGRPIAGSQGDFLMTTDWDPWFSKAACRSDEYLAGVSVDTRTRVPYSLLCCARTN